MTVNELPSMNTTVHTLSLSELAQERSRPCHANPETRREWLQIWSDTAQSRFDSIWFSGIRNLDEAPALLEQGWAAGAARVRELTAEVQAPEAKSIRR